MHRRSLLAAAVSVMTALSLAFGLRDEKRRNTAAAIGALRGGRPGNTGEGSPEIQ